MKQYYLKGFTTFFFITTVLNISKAQCLCSGGKKPDSLSYRFTLAPSKTPSAQVLFPKFNAAIGTLNCVKYWDTLNCTSTTGVKNKAPNDVTYEFQLTVSNQITGPGISFTKVVNQLYGPNDLTAFGTLGDTITYGPTKLLSNATDIKTTTNVAGYLGTGNVVFDYTINGGLISLQGGLNYRSSIETQYSGKFKLTYYYCPNTILASNIQNLTADYKNGSVQLAWLSTNAQQIGTYTIEVSTDGKIFEEVTQIIGNRQASEMYTHTFTPTANSNYLYVRVKQINDNGTSEYSAVRRVALNNSTPIRLVTYPNPAPSNSTSVTINFDRLLTGTYLASLISVTGQTVYSHTFNLSNTNNTTLHWGKPIPKGLYVVKMINQSSLQQQVTRLTVQ
jgi:hypothetical protein